MSVIHDQQRAHLEATIAWAEKIRRVLTPTLRANAHRVHFRPASTGVGLIGLLPERPQRGRTGVRDLQRIARDFEELFTRHCIEVEHGRVTGEKALQSFLIRDAQTHDGHLAMINEASRAVSEPAELLFITDEIAMPMEAGKRVCDVLALRVDGGRSIPVLLELKDKRQLKRLVEQVEGFAALIDDHADTFAKLCSVLLERDVAFDGPGEKWIVWPMAGKGTDPKEPELHKRGIRVVGYQEVGADYRFRVGASPQ